MTSQVGLDNLTDIVTGLAGGKPFVFVIMPFREMGFVFEAVRAVAEEGLQFRCIHAGMVEGTGIDLLTKIQFLIARAELIVVDISDPTRPNVFYELGYAAALNKPVIMLLNRNSQVPSDLLGLEVMRYSENVEDLIQFKQRLKDALRWRLSRDTALLRDMLQPEAGRPAYILCSPKHPTRGSPHDRKLYDEKTFGDYLGVVGLLSAFGIFFGEHGGYELISAQFFPPDLLDRPVSLYLIGSPKVNEATGEILDRIQKTLEPQWTLPPMEGRKAEGNYPCQVCRTENGLITRYPRMDDPEVLGKRAIHNWDYGIVIRSPHPDPRFRDRLVVVMAGARSVGTGAACLAATRSVLIRKIQERLPRGRSIADKRVSFWALVRGTVKDKFELLDVDDVEIIEAGVFHASDRTR